MSIQMVNPQSKKLVNVKSSQVDILKEAGWQMPNSVKAKKILSDAEKEKEEAKEKNEKLKD